MPLGSLPLESATTAAGQRMPLPHRLRLLFLSPSEPPWSLLALRLESAGCDQAEFDWHSQPGEALAKLRKSSFDCILLRDSAAPEEGDNTVLSVIEAVRASGTDDPIAVLLSRPDDDAIARYDGLNCEILVTANGWQSRALVPTLRRAVERGDLDRDRAALERAARRGRAREHDETSTQLQQLRQVVSPLVRPPAADDRDASGEGRQRPALIERIDRYYRDLLRAYVMMGNGRLGDELRKLAELLSLSNVSPQETLAIHLDQVERLMKGLGSRSSRHVMARADLLALELMIHLGECYRQKSRFRGLGDAGIDLLHADSLLNRPAATHSGMAPAGGVRYGRPATP